jgi:hypothetical protein
MIFRFLASETLSEGIFGRLGCLGEMIGCVKSSNLFFLSALLLESQNHPPHVAVLFKALSNIVILYTSNISILLCINFFFV